MKWENESDRNTINGECAYKLDQKSQVGRPDENKKILMPISLKSTKYIEKYSSEVSYKQLISSFASSIRFYQFALSMRILESIRDWNIQSVSRILNHFLFS